MTALAIYSINAIFYGIYKHRHKHWSTIRHRNNRKLQTTNKRKPNLLFGQTLLTLAQRLKSNKFSKIYDKIKIRLVAELK